MFLECLQHTAACSAYRGVWCSRHIGMLCSTFGWRLAVFRTRLVHLDMAGMLFLVVVHGCRCSVSVCLMGRLCERRRRRLFRLDYCHARFIGCWLCAVSRVLVCFSACVCTACAPMCAIQYRCCDPWLPRGRGAVILHAGVVFSQGFFLFAFS